MATKKKMTEEETHEYLGKRGYKKEGYSAGSGNLIYSAPEGSKKGDARFNSADDSVAMTKRGIGVHESANSPKKVFPAKRKAAKKELTVSDYRKQLR
jgi:hypothetical protein